MRTCLFVWDQGVVVGFGAMLPLVTVALLLGAAEEVRVLTTLRAAIETFSSYCAAVSVETLQRLLSQHCEAELRDVFDAGASYRLTLGEGAALQAVHKKVLETVKPTGAGQGPDAMERDQNALAAAALGK